MDQAPFPVRNDGSRWRRLIAGCGGLVIAASLLMSLGGPEQASVWGPLGVLVGMLTAGGVFIAGSRTLEPEERRAWTLVGIGLVLGGTGVFVIGALEVIGNTAPAFGPIDTFFVAGYVFVLAGVGKLPVASGAWRFRLRVLIDGLVGSVSVTALLWSAYLNDIWMQTDGAPLFDRLIGGLYPLLDTAMLIGLMLVMVRRGSRRFDPRLLLLGVGYAAITFADLSYLVAAAGKRFEEAEPNFVMYLITVAALLAAAALVRRVPSVRDMYQHKPPWWSMAVPYGVAVFMIWFLASHLWQGAAQGTDRVLFVAAVAVGFLVIARQSLAIQENRVLVEEERSALVSSISHELRTPLTSMIGFLELLDSNEAGLNDAERAEFTEIVRDQAHYMGRIIMDLVMLSRDEQSHLTLREETVPADDVVRAAVNTLGSNAGRVTVDAEPGLTVHVDSARVIQLVSNLLTNAARYGGSRVILRLAARGSDLLIEVHDDGPGVPKKHQATVWDRFERGAHRFSSVVQGSGIGLAIVAAIVAAHKGTKGYRPSEILGGACFWAVLPYRVVKEGKPASPVTLHPRIEADLLGR